MPRIDTKAALALFLLVPLILLGPGLLPGQVIADHGTERVLPMSSVNGDDADLPQANADIVRENLVYRRIVKESLSSGEIPWWEPSMYGGQPFVAMSHTQVLYPLTWLTLPLSPTAAHSWLLWLHLVIAGTGAFAWMRAAGRSQEAALIGGLTFLLNGMFATRHGHPQYVAVGAWLPWMLLAVEHLFGPRRLLGAVGVAATTAMMILAGHPSIYVFGSYFVGLYLLWRGLRDRQWRRGLEGFGLFALGYAVGIGLASFQFLAILEFSEFSGRSERGLGILKSRLHHWVHAFRILFPNLTGTMIDGDYWTPRFTHYWAGTLYNGVVALALALFAALWRPKQAAWVLAVTLCVVAILFSPLAFELVYPLPGFAFGRPDRASIAWFLGLAWLAALGFDAIADTEERSTRSVAGVAAIGPLVAVAAIPAVGSIADKAVPTWSMSVAWWAVGIGAVLWVLGVGAVALRDRLTRVQLAGVLVAIMLVDLGPWWREWAVARDADAIFPATETTDFLAAQPGPFRIAKIGGEPEGGGMFRVFPSNTPAAYGIHEIHGFGPLHMDWLDRLLVETEVGRRRHAWHVKPFTRPDSAASPTLDLLDVRYIVSAEPLAGLPLAHEGELLVYENDNALGRAWFVPKSGDGTHVTETAARIAAGATDPTEVVWLADAPEFPRPKPSAGPTEVSLTDWSRNAMTLAKTGPDAGFAVLSESWYPGWTATVDGEPATVHRANVLQRAVYVPEGDHTIELRYRPSFAGLATALTGVSGALVVLLLALAWRTRERELPGT